MELVSIQSTLRLISLGEENKPIWTASASGDLILLLHGIRLSIKKWKWSGGSKSGFPGAIPKHAFIGWLTLKTN